MLTRYPLTKRIVVLGALVLTVSPALAHRIRVDFDHGMHFSRYKTYRWMDSEAAPSPDPLFPNQLMRVRISGLIEEALAVRGFKRVATGGDLLIGYGVQVTEHPQFNTFYDGGGPGWGWGWGGGFSTTTVETIYEGTLVVDLVDANQKKLVFQGTSTQTISSRPERNTKRLARAVNEIFEKYPPQP
jgi:Domain of unknown function (DUF4136)